MDYTNKSNYMYGDMTNCETVGSYQIATTPHLKSLTRHERVYLLNTILVTRPNLDSQDTINFFKQLEQSLF